MNPRTILLGLLLSLAAVLPAAAAPLKIYSADLSGAAESPPNASPGTGTALVTFDPDLFTMRVQASFSGLTGTTVAAHIHCCTALADVGTAGVATTTPTFAGFPIGVTSGTYDHTFDMTLASSFNPAFVTAHGGVVSVALADLLAGLDAGKTYFNIHTSTFTGGEIRGFLHAVPAPASVALLGIGLAGLMVMRPRRQAPLPSRDAPR